MIKAAIFDLDGTLADTMDDLRTAMNAMLRSFGWAQRSRDDLLRFINKGAYSFVKDALPDDIDKDEETVQKALKTYSEFYTKCYDDKTYPYHGITDELIKLHAAGIKLGVLSNKQDRFVKVIMEKLFDAALFSEIEGQLDLPAKPDPASALRLADRMGVTADECAFIGDSDADMETAINAGMTPVAVSWGYRDADFLRKVGAKHVIGTPSETASVILGL